MAQSISEQAVACYGIKKQLNKTIEECTELTLAIMHEEDRKCTSKDVITEIADVSIMIDQLKVIYGAEAVEKEKVRKVERLVRRMGVDWSVKVEEST